MSIIELFSCCAQDWKGAKVMVRRWGRGPPWLYHMIADAVTHLAAHDQELMHKSSFWPDGVAGKPLRYLIPDMLMQQWCSRPIFLLLYFFQGKFKKFSTCLYTHAIYTYVTNPPVFYFFYLWKPEKAEKKKWKSGKATNTKSSSLKSKYFCMH